MTVSMRAARTDNHRTAHPRATPQTDSKGWNELATRQVLVSIQDQQNLKKQIPHMTERSDAPRPRRRRRRRRSGSNRDQDSGTETQTEATDARKPVVEAPPPVVDDPETFALDQKFSDLGLSEDVQRALEEKGFVHPTLIQSQMIPFALDGEDVLGQARTGTGKTAAFGLPALGMIEKGDPFAGMILVPTRELAIQVAEELKDFARHSGHQIVPVYGGQPIHKQVPKLEKRPEIIVGTPDGVSRCKTAARRAEDERWNTQAIRSIKGTPWEWGSHPKKPGSRWT